MIFNLASVVDWRVITTGKQWQVNIDDVQENARQVTHEYSIGNIVYVEMTGIYRKLYYKKQGPYRITELFDNGTFWVKLGQVRKCIYIRGLTSHFIEKADHCP